MNEDRGTGKTTRLMESAVSALADLPDNAKVYITGPHTKWLKDLERIFRASGLVDVVFIPIPQIKNGGLRGRLGVLLVDDPQDVNDRDWEILYHERIYLESKTR